MIGSYSGRPSITRTVPDVWVNPIIVHCSDALGLLPVHLDRRSSNESFHQTSDLSLYLATLLLRAYVFDDVFKLKLIAVL
jgi:hypothetical protein